MSDKKYKLMLSSNGKIIKVEYPDNIMSYEYKGWLKGIKKIHNCEELDILKFYEVMMLIANNKDLMLYAWDFGLDKHEADSDIINCTQEIFTTFVNKFSDNDFEDFKTGDMEYIDYDYSVLKDNYEMFLSNFTITYSDRTKIYDSELDIYDTVKVYPNRMVICNEKSKVLDKIIKTMEKMLTNKHFYYILNK